MPPKRPKTNRRVIQQQSNGRADNSGSHGDGHNNSKELSNTDTESVPEAAKVAGTASRVARQLSNGVTASPSSNHGNSDHGITFQGNSDAGEMLEPRQDPRERRDIREQYSRIKDDILANREDLILPGNDGLHSKLKHTDDIFTNRVKETREAAMDSGIVALISQLAKQQVQALHTDFSVFEPAEFSAKLINLIGGNQLPDAERDRARISREGWVKLGEAAQPFFKRSPALHCMFGTFEQGPPKKKIPRVQGKKDEERPVQAKGPTEPEQLSSFKDMDERQEVTTMEVEKMLKTLQHYFHESGKMPLCYFSFIVNPDSFGLTIENMFYASFLARDGLAKISLDADKLPVIEPVEKLADEDQMGRLPRHQIVMTMNKAEWKEIVKTFKIKKAMIQPRSAASATTSSAARKGKKR